MQAMIEATDVLVSTPASRTEPTPSKVVAMSPAPSFILLLKGTFTVNGDGSVSLSVTASNETVNFDAYFTPDGNTFTFVDTATGSNVNGFATRGR